MILLNRPSCSPDDLFGQGIDLNWTHVHRPPLHTRIRGNLQIVGAYLFQTSFTHIHMNTLYTHIHTHQPLFHTHSPEEKKKSKNKKSSPFLSLRCAIVKSPTRTSNKPTWRGWDARLYSVMHSLLIGSVAVWGWQQPLQERMAHTPSEWCTHNKNSPA